MSVAFQQTGSAADELAIEPDNAEAASAPPRTVQSNPSANASVAIQRATELPMIERSLEDRIRREFFARASLPAARYGVTPEDVLHHLRSAHLPVTPGPARALAFMDDIVAAVACVRNHPRAWSDAWQKHESALIRACHARLDQASAVVFTRRFWIDLHEVTTLELPIERRTGDGLPCAARPLSLGQYVGVRPLRVWLSDRLLARIEHDVARGLIRVSTRVQRQASRTSGSVPQRLAADGTGGNPTQRPGTSEAADRPRAPISARVRPEARLRLVDG
jgi:hypothetical protein